MTKNGKPEGAPGKKLTVDDLRKVVGDQTIYPQPTDTGPGAKTGEPK